MNTKLRTCKQLTYVSSGGSFKASKVRRVLARRHKGVDVADKARWAHTSCKLPATGTMACISLIHLLVFVAMQRLSHAARKGILNPSIHLEKASLGLYLNISAGRVRFKYSAGSVRDIRAVVARSVRTGAPYVCPCREEEQGRSR